MLFIRESAVRDPAELEKYTQLASEAAADFAFRPLVVYGDTEAVEGEAPDGVVLLEFASEEDAKAWYYSPSYQAAREHRLRAADYRGLLLHGL